MRVLTEGSLAATFQTLLKDWETMCLCKYEKSGILLHWFGIKDLHDLDASRR